MEISCSNQRVLVTAGAAGIGRAIAETFAAAGARVYVCDADAQALAGMASGEHRIAGCVADVSNPQQVDALFDAAVAHLGGLDVLVNNAGIAGPTGPVEDIEIADWDRTIAVDLNGMFYCTRRAVPWLKAAGGGSIINMSSVAGRLGFPLRTPYASAKWAVIGFTKSLAMELGPARIRANAIEPGPVSGERMDRVIRARADALGVGFDAAHDEVVSKISLRRMVTVQDIANMALFLASAAGASITGQELSVCGNVETMA